MSTPKPILAEIRSHGATVEVVEGTIADAVAALAPDQEVKSWKELMPTIASMLESANGMIQVMFLIVYIAIGILILNAMLMVVFERIREFGVLKALGYGPSAVMRLIFAEAGIQTVLAMLVGGALAVPMLWYLVTHGINLTGMSGLSVMGMTLESNMKAVVGRETLIAPIVLLIFVVGFAVLYPALKAALIRPVEAMRHR